MLEPTEIAKIAQEVAKGNRSAFRLIVRAYSLPLRSYLASHVHSLDDVDDLAQDVFLAAFVSLQGFRQGESFNAWLRGIARNKVYNHLRRTTRFRRALESYREQVARLVESELEQAVAGDNAEKIEVLLRCVGVLPEKLRCVVRSGLDGDKPAAVAEALGTTVGAVYRLHYRANQLLRTCLERAYANGPGSA